jgi:hypothetical protein
MTPDVKGLLLGAVQAAPRSSAATQLGRRTADSPFAVLLASAASGRGARGAPLAGVLDGASPQRPALDVRAATATPDGSALPPHPAKPARAARAALPPGAARLGLRSPTLEHRSIDRRDRAAPGDRPATRRLRHGTGRELGSVGP